MGCIEGLPVTLKLHALPSTAMPNADLADVALQYYKSPGGKNHRSRPEVSRLCLPHMAVTCHNNTASCQFKLSMLVCCSKGMLYVLPIECAAFSQPFYRIQQSLSWAFHGLAVAICSSAIYQ